MRLEMGRGDDGLTDLLRGGRVLKTSPHVEALGAIDEAIAAVGLARSLATDPGSAQRLAAVAEDLGKCAAEISAPIGERATRFDFGKAAQDVEEEVASIVEAKGQPAGFMTPGESSADAALNLARTIVRRAERRVFAIDWEDRAVYPLVAAYINRLSHLLFALSYPGKQQSPPD